MNETNEDPHADHQTAVGQLLSLFRSLKAQPNQSISVVAGWSRVLPVEVDNAKATLAALAGVITLATNAREDVAGLGTRRANQLYTKWNRVDAVLGHLNLEAPLQSVTAHLGEELLVLLEAAHFDLLAIGTKPLPDKVVKRFRTRLERLQKDVHASNLPQEVRRALLAMIGQGLVALAQNQLHGAPGFETALFTQIGYAAKHAAVLDAYQSEPLVRETRTLARVMANIAAKINNNPGVVTLAVGALQAGASLLAGVAPVMIGMPGPMKLLGTGSRTGMAE